MRREGLRRLELWLPVNHPIWAYPSGARARVAAGMLDVALALEARLAGIEARLSHLEEKLDGGARAAAAGERKLDPTSFLAAFGD